jgi:hypothetical protein
MIAILVSLLSFPAVSVSSAYSPPAPFVVSRSIRERKGLRSVEWGGKVTDQRTKSVFKESMRIDFASGKIGLQYFSPSDEPLGGVQTDLGSLSKLGRFWLTVTLDPNIQRVRAALEALGVLPGEETETRLQRIDANVAWSYGDAAKILFLKDEFRPLAYLGTEERVVFESFLLSGKALQVPKAVRIGPSTGEWYRFELKSVKVDVPQKGSWATTPVEAPQVKEWISLVR